MKTVVATPEGVDVEERPDPHPAAGEVVLEVHSCGVCGSDLHQVTTPGRRNGQILGHELAGTVVELGKGVVGVDVGQRFAVNPLGSCGTCDACRAGLPILCRHLPNLGLNAPGGFAEFVSVAAGQLVSIPDGVDTEVGAHAEPLSVALGAIKLGGSPEGKDALVFGIGAIGLSVILALRARGVRHIVAVGRAPGRRAAAARLGADVVLDAREMSITDFAAANDYKFDVAYECSGASDALGAIAPTMKLRGSIVAVGLYAGPGTFDLRQLLGAGLQIVGSCAYDYATFNEAAEMLWSGEVDPDPIVSERLSLIDTPDGMRRLAQPDSLVGLLVQPWR